MVTGPLADLRIAVTGAGGLVGRSVTAAFRAAGASVTALPHADLDITAADIAEGLAGHDVIINPAAMTDVDACERAPEQAARVNAEGAGNVARAGAEIGAYVVIISTDFVFDGEAGNYSEFDEANPIQTYGRTKLDGERAAASAGASLAIVRSAWIYGSGGRNHLSVTAGRLADVAEVSVVGDQWSSPTSADDLARGLVELVSKRAEGTFHLINEGRCSRAEWLSHAAQRLGLDVDVIPISWDDVGGERAPRPVDTSMRSVVWEQAGFTPLRSWRDALDAFLS